MQRKIATIPFSFQNQPAFGKLKFSGCQLKIATTQNVIWQITGVLTTDLKTLSFLNIQNKKTFKIHCRKLNDF